MIVQKQVKFVTSHPRFTTYLDWNCNDCGKTNTAMYEHDVTRHEERCVYCNSVYYVTVESQYDFSTSVAIWQEETLVELVIKDKEKNGEA